MAPFDKYQGKASYADYAMVVGVLETVKGEFQRRLLEPYEDVKREERGDVY